MQPNLTLANIARNPSESVRPDLWPSHAWIPALGIQGETLWDVASGCTHGVLSTTAMWSGSSLVCNGSAGRFCNCSEMYTMGALLLPFTFLAVVKPNYSESGRIAFSAGTYSTSGDRTSIGTLAGKSHILHRVGADTIREASGDVRIDDGRWHVIIGTFFSANPGGYLYTDGVFEVNTAYEFSQINYDATVIGSLPRLSTYDAGPRFDGLIAMAGVFRRALNVAEIRTLSADPLLPFRRKLSVSFYVSGIDAGSPSFESHVFSSARFISGRIR